MKCLLLSLLLISAAAQAQMDSVHLIPEPVSVRQSSGRFVLPAEVVIEAKSDTATRGAIELLQTRLQTAAGATVRVQPSAPSAAVRLQLLSARDAEIGTEGYRLSVTADGGATIRANTGAGLFYGAQTLLQLMPDSIESRRRVQGVTWAVPVVEVTDYPRFGWRGLMFDVSRHFFGKEDVKLFIDDMVRYKFNLLHLHLADDEGWRLQVKALPKLTSVGAWNVKRTGYYNSFAPTTPDEKRDYGGFFTHEDIRELVAYAKARYVNILPEIDVPGHSLAAIASYPELSCTPGANKYVVRSGEKIMEWHNNGTFTALVDNTLCPANEKVYEFLDKVFTEVAQLFPFEYIHMGGDETAKNFWQKNPQVLALMKREKLKDMHEVQSYFVKRVEKIINSKGKKMIGWDEILEGGLAPNAAVMSWRGLKGGIEAAKMGHEVVMSPTTFAYLDYMQGDAILEPRIYASLRLSKAYQFEPVPEGVDPKYIKGGQANLWTENVYNMRHAQYMLWPRAMAVSESVWSPAAKKNWNDFSRRVEDHFGRLQAAGVKYAPSMYEPLITAKNVAGGLQVTLTGETEGVNLHYTWDNSYPDEYYPVYSGPITAPRDAFQLRVQPYKDGRAVGRMMTITVEELKKRAGAK